MRYEWQWISTKTDASSASGQCDVERVWVLAELAGDMGAGLLVAPVDIVANEWAEAIVRAARDAS